MRLDTLLCPVSLAESSATILRYAAALAHLVESDGRPVGCGRPGKVTAELQRLYREVVFGRVPDYSSWCYPVFISRSRQAA